MATDQRIPFRSAPPGFETMSPEASRALLGGSVVGRVVLASAVRPHLCAAAIQAGGVHVRFGVEPDWPIPWMPPDAVVALEADHLDPADAWSVVITGAVTPIDAPGKSSASLRWFELEPELVTGRRIRAIRPVRRRAAPLGLVPAGSGALAPAESLRLLGSGQIGRLAVCVAGRPRIFPVNYALDGDAVVFRTASGTKLHALSRSLVAFEADSFSSDGSGWSVVVEGVAQELTAADPESVRARAAALAFEPWAPGDRPYFVRILAFSVRGYSHSWPLSRY